MMCSVLMNVGLGGNLEWMRYGLGLFFCGVAKEWGWERWWRGRDNIVALLKLSELLCSGFWLWLLFVGCCGVELAQYGTVAG